MNDDHAKHNAPASMDEVLAQAARLGREARRSPASREAGVAGTGAIDTSLQAIASHARQEAAARSAQMRSAQQHSPMQYPTVDAAVTDMSEVIAATHHESAAQRPRAPSRIAAVATAFASALVRDGTAVIGKLQSARSHVPRKAVLAVTATLVLCVAGGVAFQRLSPFKPSSPLAVASPKPAPVSPPRPVTVQTAAPIAAAPAAVPVVASVAAPAVAAVIGPAIGMVVDPSDAGSRATAEHMSAEWRKSGILSATDVAASGWSAGLAALAVQPRIAVVRYDALQAARSAPVAAHIPPLEIVAPIAVDPIYFVVRADSPLQFIHQLRGKSINAGAAGSNRALTTSAVYRGMFNEPLAASALRGQDESAALQSLANGKLDVLVLVGAAATAWFDTSGEAAFKLLSLDPNQPQANKALGTYLPVMASARSLGVFPATATQTLAVMSFVVTAKPMSGDPGEQDVAMTRVAQSLCGGAQAVDPGLQLQVGWPYSEAAQAVFKRCAGKAGTSVRSVATATGTS